MEVRERFDEVLTVRMPGWERFALDQMADLTGANRSEVVRHAIATAMRKAMLEHPQYALHPTWVNAGNDQWAVSMYRHWACVLAADDPAEHLEWVVLDGMGGYKLRLNDRTPKLHEWPEHGQTIRELVISGGQR